MEQYIPISYLNDFIFCPRSIYFHQLYGNSARAFYHERAQIEGIAAHKAVDARSYSTRKNILQGIEVYSEQYRLCGKIDIFDTRAGLLTERKKRINTVYDGYVLQIYAQYHALTEMGYTVSALRLYSMDTNSIFPVKLPHANPPMQLKFENVVQQLAQYSLEDDFVANPKKCVHCIYNQLCDKAAC